MYEHNSRHLLIENLSTTKDKNCSYYFSSHSMLKYLIPLVILNYCTNNKKHKAILSC